MIRLPVLLPRKQVFHSKINSEITLFEFLGKKSLFVGGATQSGGFTEAMWEIAINKIQNPKSKIQNSLILGIGGGTVIRLLRNYYPEMSITGVEIDPVMVEIAQKYFYKESVLPAKIIINDAVAWVKQQKERNIFDLIIVDLYVGKLNPKKSRTKKFLLALKQLLAKSGVVLYNSHYQESNSLEYEKFKNNCKQVFVNFEEILRYPLSRLLLLK